MSHNPEIVAVQQYLSSLSGGREEDCTTISATAIVGHVIPEDIHNLLLDKVTGMDYFEDVTLIALDKAYPEQAHLSLIGDSPSSLLREVKKVYSQDRGVIYRGSYFTSDEISTCADGLQEAHVIALMRFPSNNRVTAVDTYAPAYSNGHTRTILPRDVRRPRSLNASSFIRTVTLRYLDAHAADFDEPCVAFISIEKKLLESDERFKSFSNGAYLDMMNTLRSRVHQLRNIASQVSEDTELEKLRLRNDQFCSKAKARREKRMRYRKGVL